MKVLRFITKVKSFSDKIRDDHLSAFSAQATFYIIFSFFPFTMFLLTMTQYLPMTQSNVMEFIISIVPSVSQSVVVTIVEDLYTKSTGAILSISIITALWSASRGILSITKGLNSIYDIDETRNFFVLRIFSAFYTVLFTIAIVLVLTLIIFGNSLYWYISRSAPFLVTIANSILNFRMIFISIILLIFFTLMYCYIPNRKTTFWQELPGSIITTLGWAFLSFAFSIYIDYFSNFSYMYGSLTSIIIIMLWLYTCMNLFFFGAEVNLFLTKSNLGPAFRKKDDAPSE